MRNCRGRLLHVSLEQTSSVPLYRQLYSEIRTGILHGRIQSGVKLPSTRALSVDLGVSRSTVVLAYEHLRAEGYLRSKLGAGTQVSKVIPDTLASPPPIQHSDAGISPRRVARRSSSLKGIPDFAIHGSGTARAFRGAVPALDVFPIELWSRIVNRSLRKLAPRQLSYGDPFGYEPLREAIANYLITARGVRCRADQVMIVAGAQQGLKLCASTVLNQGDAAWMEDPGYFGIRAVLEAAEATVVPVKVDCEGLDVSYGRARAPDARAAFVTPSRQRPLGVTMSLARRLSLLEWASQSRAWLIEDDYDSEFRYVSRPLGALQGLDREGCVIFAGTFSKVMFPALRLGYVVIPDSIHDDFDAARRFSDFHCPQLEQGAMAEFIREGHFESHIRRMRGIYSARKDVLVEALKTELAGRVEVGAADAGMSLVAWLHPGDDAERLTAIAARAGIDIMPLSHSVIEHQVTPGVMLGFSGISEMEIRAGVRVLAQALEEYDRSRGQWEMQPIVEQSGNADLAMR